MKAQTGDLVLHKKLGITGLVISTYQDDPNFHEWIYRVMSQGMVHLWNVENIKNYNSMTNLEKELYDWPKI